MAATRKGNSKISKAETRAHAKPASDPFRLALDAETAGFHLEAARMLLVDMCEDIKDEYLYFCLEAILEKVLVENKALHKGLLKLADHTRPARLAKEVSHA